MKALGNSFPAEPFFLKAGSGELFCLYHAPSPNKHCFGAFIYIHPFADEMNKSRRMAALQARAFARMGFAVLQIDLFGCGDSSGEFRDARWDIWKQNLADAKRWLENHVASPVSLWGLRLGALLALDFARHSENKIDKIVLWQPIISGQSFLNQFLRLRMASEMFAATEGAFKPTGTGAMRDCLANGQTLEVAGYELSPDLAGAIDRLKACELLVLGSTIHWFEIVAELGRSMAPTTVKVMADWRAKGVDLQAHVVPCAPFWATQEIVECPELVSATGSVSAIMYP